MKAKVRGEKEGARRWFCSLVDLEVQILWQAQHIGEPQSADFVAGAALGGP